MIVNFPTLAPWTLACMAGSMALYATVAAHARRLMRPGAHHMGWRLNTALLVLAWLLHAAALALVLLIPPRFGFAAALSMTALLAVLLYVAESHVYPPLRHLRQWLAVVCAATLPLMWLFADKPLPAGTSAWLPLHLALGIVSYGLFALAVLHAWLMARAEQRLRIRPTGGVIAAGAAVDLPLLTLERLTFRFVQAGFVLLTITIAQGVLLYDQLLGAHGHSAGMAHKMVFAVLSWLVFAVLIGGRWHYGWRGQRAVRMVYAGAVCLLLSYIGTQFVLQVLLQRTS